MNTPQEGESGKYDLISILFFVKWLKLKVLRKYFFVVIKSIFI